MRYRICWLGLHDYYKIDGVWRCLCGKRKDMSLTYDVPPITTRVDIRGKLSEEILKRGNK